MMVFLYYRVIDSSYRRAKSRDISVGIYRKKEVAFLPAKNSIVESDVRISNYVNM